MASVRSSAYSGMSKSPKLAGLGENNFSIHFAKGLKSNIEKVSGYGLAKSGNQNISQSSFSAGKSYYPDAKGT